MKNSTSTSIETRELANYIASSALYQAGVNAGPDHIGVNADPAKNLLDVLTEEAMPIANDIIEVCKNNPHMFFTMMMAGITSVMVNIINRISGE